MTLVFYASIFLAIAVGTGFMTFKSSRGMFGSPSTPNEFQFFQKKYLLVYLLVSMADWMQGPYVYKLYDSYGYDMATIGTLFVTGFASSAIFGTFVGAFADRFGRKLNCVCFGFLYSFACFLKHFNYYPALLLGRFCAGISTSILMSAFEAWMIHEHNERGFRREWLSDTFAKGIFGNSVVAICAGLLSSALASMFGFVAPFDGSILLLLAGTYFIMKTWSENYGAQQSASTPLLGSISLAIDYMRKDNKILLLGLIQSAFEGSMYIFVFMWSPTLESTAEPDMPHGVIFAIYMVCIMLGSNLFSKFTSAPHNYSIEYAAVVTFCVASLALASVVMIESHLVNLAAFCVFEMCCGVYFPSMGVMRGKIIPEDVRATVMNIFRIGLNVLVVIVLLNLDTLTGPAIFSFCSLLLTLAAVGQYYIMKLLEHPGVPTTPEESKQLVGEDKE